VAAIRDRASRQLVEPTNQDGLDASLRALLMRRKRGEEIRRHNNARKPQKKLSVSPADSLRKKFTPWLRQVPAANRVPAATLGSRQRRSNQERRALLAQDSMRKPAVPIAGLARKMVGDDGARFGVCQQDKQGLLTQLNWSVTKWTWARTKNPCCSKRKVNPS